MRKMMIALAAAFSVSTATMTSGTPAAFARGGGSFGGGTHGFGGGGFGGHGFALGRSDGGHFRGGFGQLAAAFGTGASADLDLASMDTRAGSTPITAMAPVWCPLLTATPGLATDIQHRNLLSALHRNGCGAFTNPWAGNKTAALRGLRRHSATYGDVTRHIACLRRRLSRVEVVGDAFLRRSISRCADHQCNTQRAGELID